MAALSELMRESTGVLLQVRATVLGVQMGVIAVDQLDYIAFQNYS